MQHTPHNTHWLASAAAVNATAATARSWGVRGQGGAGRAGGRRGARTFLRWPCASTESAVLVDISLTALASLPPTPLSTLASDLPRESEALTCRAKVQGRWGVGGRRQVCVCVGGGAAGQVWEDWGGGVEDTPRAGGGSPAAPRCPPLPALPRPPDPATSSQPIPPTHPAPPPTQPPPPQPAASEPHLDRLVAQLPAHDERRRGLANAGRPAEQHRLLGEVGGRCLAPAAHTHRHERTRTGAGRQAGGAQVGARRLGSFSAASTSAQAHTQ